MSKTINPHFPPSGPTQWLRGHPLRISEACSDHSCHFDGWEFFAVRTDTPDGEGLFWEQEVVSSNLAAPTLSKSMV
jgi:hypothetical protein